MKIKTYLFIVSIMISKISYAHVNKCDHVHLPNGRIVWDKPCGGFGSKAFLIEPEFQIKGHYCANPYSSEAPNYQAATQVADKIASKHCYPFQAERMSEYKYSTDHECRPNFSPSTATANYSCAR